MHGSGWVGLRGFFDPTHHGGLKKSNSTQPTQIRLGWVESMGWTVFIIIIFLLLLLLT